jgi:hypothetical protein
MKKLTASLLTAAALTVGALQPALAVEVGGIKLEDSMTVAGKPLVLNGAGIRVKAIFKVYALGLYLTEKKTAVADILSLGGPKRFKIVLMRDLTSEEFGQAFLTGINKNLDKEEKAKFVNQLVRLGEVFNEVDGVKKGDTVIGDFIPGTGTTFTINGKSVGAPFADPAFYGAILRIWIGANPADSSLKPLLLGGE